MIRKIILFVLLIFSIIWFAIAYTIKGNIITLINNSESDNIKISYDQVKVSGYPTKWKIHIIDPKVRLINHFNSKEIVGKELIILVNFCSLSEATLILGKELKQIENFGDKITEYIIRSDQDIKLLMGLDKSLYEISRQDNLESITGTLKLAHKLLSVIYQDKEIFNIEDLSFRTKHGSGDMDLALHLIYNGQEEFLNFKKAELTLDMSVDFTLANNETDPKGKFDIRQLIFACDNDAKVDLNGSLKLFKNKLPHGKLSFSLTNYHHIIDKLILDNFMMSKKTIKMIIEKAVSSSITNGEKTDNDSVSYENVKFNIEFSDDGIKIGSINLLEFNLDNNNIGDNIPSNDPAH